MTWFRVDDKFWAHPKVAQLPLTAVGLWVKAGSYCAQFETDGALSSHNIRTLGAQKRDAERLVNAELWDKTEDGYCFRDWSDYQWTKDDLSLKRRADRARKAQWRKAKSRKVSQRDKSVTDGVTNEGVTLFTHTNTNTNTNNPYSPLEGDSVTEKFNEFWKAFPSARKAAKSKCLAKFKAIVKKGIDPDVVIQGAKAYRDDPNRTDQYTVNPHTWLIEERWEAGPLPGRANQVSQAEEWINAGRELSTKLREVGR